MKQKPNALNPETWTPKQATITTRCGNFLILHYNPKDSTIMVELVAANEKGGNEFVRHVIDEKALLAHVK